MDRATAAACTVKEQKVPHLQVVRHLAQSLALRAVVQQRRKVHLFVEDLLQRWQQRRALPPLRRM